MKNSCMRRAVSAVMLLIAGVVGAQFPAPPAHACSCALPSPARASEQGGTGFIGVFEGQSSSLQRAVFRVVEAAPGLPASAGQSIEVRPAACPFEIRPGAEVGILLYRVDGEWAGGLCTTIPADVLRAYLHPPQLDAGVAVRYLLATPDSARHLYFFDTNGKLGATATYEQPVDPSRPGAARGLQGASLCPGQRYLIESWETAILVRDLTTLVPRPLAGVPGLRVHCADAEAARVYTFEDDRDGLHVRDLARRDVSAGPWRLLDARGGRVLVTSRVAPSQQATLIELSTGTPRPLAGAALPTSAALVSGAFSPDGLRIALVYASGLFAQGRLDIVDLEGRVQASKEVGSILPADRGWPQLWGWVGNDAVLFGSPDAYLLDARDLSARGSRAVDPEWFPSNEVFAEGDELISVRAFGAITSGASAARTRTVFAAPVSARSWLWRLDTPVSFVQPPVSAAAPTVSVQPPPIAEEEQATPSVLRIDPAIERPGSRRALAVSAVAIAAVIAVTGTVLVRSRRWRGRRTTSHS